MTGGGMGSPEGTPEIIELVGKPMDEIKGEVIHRGKAKIVYKTIEDGVLLMEFMDDATAFDGEKQGSISSKGMYNSHISAAIMRHLNQCGVRTHFLEQLEDRFQLVRPLDMLPIEVVIRNQAAGSLARRLGFSEGGELERPILEYYFKSDELGDPWLNRYHIRTLDLCSDAEIVRLEEDSWRINAMLRDFFRERQLELIDFKLEYGRGPEQELVLGDEITPDTCRLWDIASGDKLDKDRFRDDMGDVEEAYQEVYRRVVWED